MACPGQQRALRHANGRDVNGIETQLHMIFLRNCDSIGNFAYAILNRLAHSSLWLYLYRLNLDVEQVALSIWGHAPRLIYRQYRGHE